MTTIRCKITEPYTTRSLVGEFTWFVYNKRMGNIVAATYSEDMAKAILAGIDITNIYQDDYGICEQYRSPEPMV